ncbi:MAG TPA: 4'-phosphopantetheinyl transferase superfamily protein [Casimicrobiaceae bacterium]|nr:4'-phosphopantetheinyl transferase superfamily protein [Casimicrobiaceae bacterium]
MPRQLRSPVARIELWWCELAADDSALEVYSQWLSEAERQRASRYGKPALARRYIAGRAALRWILARERNIDPAAVPIEQDRRGRPRSHGGPDFNVSNTRGIALIALSRLDGVRVGVDVEHRDRKLEHVGLSRKYLTRREQESLEGRDDDERRRTFLRLWTCKEAMSKATGDALSAPIRAIDVSQTPTLRLIHGPPPYEPQAWTLHALDVPESFIATLAVWRMEIV